jgi:hypothetical protein
MKLFEGPHICSACGEHIGSVLSTDPYDYGAARRELEAIHAFVRAYGMEQGSDGEWGRVLGYEEPEWDEIGGTVEALKWIASQEGYGGFCQGMAEEMSKQAEAEARARVNTVSVL